MPSDDGEPSTPSPVDKGKRRAQEPTEHTPLLQDDGISSEDTLFSPPSAHSSRRRLHTILTTVFLTSLAICIVVAVAVALFLWSYASRVSSLSPDEVLNKDVFLHGPFHVDVHNATDKGVWLNVSGRIGFDAGDAIGVNREATHYEEDADGLLRRVWKAIGRWGIRRLDTVTVNFTTVNIAPEYDTSLVLASVQLPPFQIPLAVDPPRHSSDWMSPVTVPVFVKPTTNATTLVQFLTESWRYASFTVQANVAQVVIIGGNGRTWSWRSKFRGTMRNIQTSIRVNIPSLPGLPQPGKHAPLPSVSDFLTLRSFHIYSQQYLSVYAEASILNPLTPEINIQLPSLPFTISLPDSDDSRLPIANVVTHPTIFTHPNITLHVNGIVPPIPKSSSPVLSNFLSRYLNGEANRILISTPLFSNSNSSEPSDDKLEVPCDFPGPSPRPKILRDVTIREMKIRPQGTNFVASGIVYARVVLPKGIDVGVDVHKLFPDVLVFDGEVPEAKEWFSRTSSRQAELGQVSRTAREGTPPTPELPSPLPERAFGRIIPEEWLPSTSVRLESEDEHGAVYAVSAKVTDVPLDVLPGRQKEFSNFVGKVIFGTEGAIAGLQGYVAVSVDIDGLPLSSGSGNKDARFELTGLPFRGSVRIGKKGL